MLVLPWATTKLWDNPPIQNSTGMSALARNTAIIHTQAKSNRLEEQTTISNINLIKVLAAAPSATRLSRFPKALKLRWLISTNRYLSNSSMPAPVSITKICNRFQTTNFQTCTSPTWVTSMLSRSSWRTRWLSWTCKRAPTQQNLHLDIGSPALLPSRLLASATRRSKQPQRKHTLLLRWMTSRWHRTLSNRWMWMPWERNTPQHLEIEMTRKTSQEWSLYQPSVQHPSNGKSQLRTFSKMTETRTRSNSTSKKWNEFQKYWSNNEF